MEQQKRQNVANRTNSLNFSQIKIMREANMTGFYKKKGWWAPSFLQTLTKLISMKKNCTLESFCLVQTKIRDLTVKKLQVSLRNVKDALAWMVVNLSKKKKDGGRHPIF
ncbi:hypothetical protein [Gaoshiqia sediminis]|uniref:Uncharacterized protein n=1 Tax=Gaoshiqia sediminis TaxID=2986998 RepID=A0AA41Y9X0_9BACT|nr:hypothetical protein [Gaoshiqia sediminis]MCW0481945.1 hypothetical protein [Gaoshiqia sediminis]